MKIMIQHGIYKYCNKSKFTSVIHKHTDEWAMQNCKKHTWKHDYSELEYSKPHVQATSWSPSI